MKNASFKSRWVSLFALLSLVGFSGCDEDSGSSEESAEEPVKWMLPMPQMADWPAGEYTIFFCDIVLVTHQREVAGQNVDRFDFTSDSILLAVEHTRDEPREVVIEDQTMKITLISRSDGSDQAPTRLKESFPLKLTGFHDKEGGFYQFNIHPLDVTEYSLVSTGQIYGECSVLQPMMSHGKAPGVQGTLQTFALPADVEPLASWEFKIQTPKENKSWFEGDAHFGIYQKITGTLDENGEWHQKSHSGDMRRK